MDEIVIREFKRLAAEGCHADVADALDNVGNIMQGYQFYGSHLRIVTYNIQCMNSIHRPSRLHTSLFHTLRKICTEYSYLPNSLFLPPQTMITGISNDARATGGYADVYIARQYGNLTGDYICVKAVRISDRDKSGARMKVYSSMVRRTVIPSNRCICRSYARKHCFGVIYPIQTLHPSMAWLPSSMAGL